MHNTDRCPENVIDFDLLGIAEVMSAQQARRLTLRERPSINHRLFTRRRAVANIASAEKANRQRITHRIRNLFHLTTMRSHVKRVRTAIAAKDAAAAKSALHEAVSVIDRTAQKGVIDKKTAARKI